MLELRPERKNLPASYDVRDPRTILLKPGHPSPKPPEACPDEGLERAEIRLLEIDRQRSGNRRQDVWQILTGATGAKWRELSENHQGSGPMLNGASGLLP
jgi:hypothetical protein